MSEKVILLIRSALCNGDRKIEATLDWTVMEVKKQLEKDWPNQPPPHDQRLVYAGKLLQDASRLKEVLRLEDLPQPFIVHLVCRQHSPPPTATTSPRANSDGLRRRTTQTSTTTSPTSSASNQSVPSTSTSSSPGMNASSPWMQSYAGHAQQFDGQAIDQVNIKIKIYFPNKNYESLKIVKFVYFKIRRDWLTTK